MTAGRSVFNQRRHQMVRDLSFTCSGVAALALVCTLSVGARCDDALEFNYDPHARAVYIRGTFEPGAAERFQQFIEVSRVGEGELIYLHSPGGSLQEGMKIGQLIRARRLRT